MEIPPGTCEHPAPSRVSSHGSLLPAQPMSTPELFTRLVFGLLLVGANAFFVMAEFALTRIRQLDQEDFTGDRRLELAWEMTDRLEIYLTACQLGITASSIVMGVVAEPAVTGLLSPLASAVGVGPDAVPWVSVVLSVAVINLVHAVWGEQAPTYLGVERPREVARRTARGIYWWTRALRPVIAAGDRLAKWTLGLIGVTMRRSWTEAPAEADGDDVDRAELRRRMGEVLAGGGLSRDRRQEILNALAIQHLPVHRIMVPREEMVTFSTQVSLDENLGRLARRGHVRVPLLGEGGEADVRGVLYVAALVAHMDKLRSGATSLEALAVPAMRVPAGLEVSTLIDRFQDEEQELALVEEEGTVIGIVTTTDAFEAIIGELRDPFD